MEPRTSNVIKSVAKKVNEDIANLRASNPKRELDDICREAIDKNYPPLKALGIARDWLVWHVGVLNGVFEDR